MYHYYFECCFLIAYIFLLSSCLFISFLRLKNLYIICCKRQQVSEKTLLKIEFIINCQSVGCSELFKKMLNWVSKGAYLSFERASFKAQKGVSLKPKDGVLNYVLRK